MLFSSEVFLQYNTLQLDASEICISKNIFLHGRKWIFLVKFFILKYIFINAMRDQGKMINEKYVKLYYEWKNQILKCG